MDIQDELLLLAASAMRSAQPGGKVCIEISGDITSFIADSLSCNMSKGISHLIAEQESEDIFVTGGE